MDIAELGLLGRLRLDRLGVNHRLGPGMLTGVVEPLGQESTLNPTDEPTVHRNGPFTLTLLELSRLGRGDHAVRGTIAFDQIAALCHGASHRSDRSTAGAGHHASHRRSGHQESENGREKESTHLVLLGHKRTAPFSIPTTRGQSVSEWVRELFGRRGEVLLPLAHLGNY